MPPEDAFLGFHRRQLGTTDALRSINEEPALYVATVGAGTPAVKLNSGNAIELDAMWAPSPRITFDNGSDVLTINGDGTGILNVTQDSSAQNTSPVVTSNGNTIVFASARDNAHEELWSIPSAGGTATQITQNTIAHGGDRALDISHDGSLVAFLRTTQTVSGNNVTTATALGVIEMSGAGLHTFNAPNENNAAQVQFSNCQ